MKTVTSNFREYAEFYDLLHRDKDYPAEAAFIAGLLTDHFRRPSEKISVLDMACGTGRHALEMLKLGHPVAGSDISPEMIACAQERAARQGATVKFHNYSFQECGALDGRFDAITVLFSAIDYLLDHKDLVRMLENVKKLLLPGGVLLFDYWNGNAVLDDYSPVRVRRATDGKRTIQRISTTTIDTLIQVAVVNFDFMLIEEGMGVREFSEIHRMRYYFPQEMLDLLEGSGFEVVMRCPFMQPGMAMQPKDWNITVIARPCT